MRESLQRATQPPPSRGDAFAAGEVVAHGRISIIRRIGGGGMGAVYEAFDSERKTRVALKTLSRHGAADIYLFKNEFRSLADVTHPNLVSLHELFEERGVWFFTMDLLGGARIDRDLRSPGAPAPR